MKKKDKNKSAAEFETIFGREIEVHYKKREEFDEDELKKLGPLAEFCGTSETISIKEIRRSDIPKYFQASTSQDELTVANLTCRKGAGSPWSMLLTNESFDRVLDTSQEFNLPLLGAWFRRTMKRNEALMPGQTDIVAQALQVAIAAEKKKQSDAASPGSSPTTQ